MRKLEEIQTWLTEANSYTPTPPSAGVPTQLPLVVQTAGSVGATTSRYDVIGPGVIIPQTGEILHRGATIRYKGVIQYLPTGAPVTGTELVEQTDYRGQFTGGASITVNATDVAFVEAPATGSSLRLHAPFPAGSSIEVSMNISAISAGQIGASVVYTDGTSTEMIAPQGTAGVYNANLVVTKDVASLCIDPQVADATATVEDISFIYAGSGLLATNPWDDLVREDYLWVLDDLARNGVSGQADETVEAFEAADFSISEEVAEAEQEANDADQAVEAGIELAESAGAEDTESYQAAETVEVPNFSSMTKSEIDAWALEQGIEVDGRTTKAAMIEIIETELAKR